MACPIGHPDTGEAQALPASVPSVRGPAVRQWSADGFEYAGRKCFAHIREPGISADMDDAAEGTVCLAASSYACIAENDIGCPGENGLHSAFAGACDIHSMVCEMKALQDIPDGPSPVTMAVYMLPPDTKGQGLPVRQRMQGSLV